QPPGIDIPIADMDAHQTIVSVVLPAKSNAETPTNAASEGRSAAMRREISRSAVAATITLESVHHARVSAESRSSALRSTRFRKAASPASDTPTHFRS